MILGLLGLAIYIFVLISPLVLIDVLGGWTFLIYPLYILTYIGFNGISQEAWVKEYGEPPDGPDHWYMGNMSLMIGMTIQGLSALIFFIIFAFNDGAGAFSTFIIGSIILAIIIKFNKYFQTFMDNYTKFLEWVYRLYKKFFRDY